MCGILPARATGLQQQGSVPVCRYPRADRTRMAQRPNGPEPIPGSRCRRVARPLYVQGRGDLRRELANALRTGRTRRKPHRQAASHQPRFTHPMILISERPAEATDRAVPGHWEGDLIIGKDGASAIGTLVERTTRYVMLLHLPDGRSAEHVRDALVETIQVLPPHLTRSLTWDQGCEMARITPSASPPTSRSTSAIPPALGSAARTRTRTACYGSTFPRARICPSTPGNASTPSPPNSTDD